MAELISMMNIGKGMAKKLDSVGIGSAEEPIRSGAELKEYGRVCKRTGETCSKHGG